MLQLARFFEATVATLFHGHAPEPRELTLGASLPLASCNGGIAQRNATDRTASQLGQNRAVTITVAIVNQKGGVGKTTVTTGLASAAAARGRRVVVVDLDPQGASSWVLGVDPDTVSASAADLFEKQALDRVVTPSTWGDRVMVVPAARRLQDHEAGKPKRLRSTLEQSQVVAAADLVVLDCPPSLGNITRSALTAADRALIVVEPSVLGLRGLGAVADLIDDVWDRHHPGLDLAGVVVNRVPAVSAEAERRVEELTRIVGRESVWRPFIPQRVIITQAQTERRPIHAYGARAGDLIGVFDALWTRLRRTSGGSRLNDREDRTT